MTTTTTDGSRGKKRIRFDAPFSLSPRSCVLKTFLHSRLTCLRFGCVCVVLNSEMAFGRYVLSGNNRSCSFPFQLHDDDGCHTKKSRFKLRDYYSREIKVTSTYCCSLHTVLRATTLENKRNRQHKAGEKEK